MAPPLLFNEYAGRSGGGRLFQKARRTVMLKNLFAHIPTERPQRPVVDAAVSLAVARAAHLDAASIGFETTNVGLAFDGGAAMATVIEIEQERALTRASAALAVFETEARNAGISYGLQPLIGAPVETVATVSAMHGSTI
jgi:hypothetical protein